MMQRSLTLLSTSALACLAGALLLPACGGGGGGGGGGPKAVVLEAEPNNDSTTALSLSLDGFGTGDVATIADVDYWKAQLSSGSLVRVELVGTRLDQAGWDGSINVPRVTVWDTDGTSKLLEHDYGGFTSDGWSHGAHDLDMPLFRVPATGTYFVSVTQDDQTLAGGEYAVRFARVSLSSLQQETEAAGATGGNDTSATAQTLNPGNLRGFHVDDESDFFSFTVTTPSIVRLELTTYRNGVFGGDDEYYDPYLYLYDTDGTTELQSNDDTYFYDSALEHRLVDPGTYFVEVTECCGAGDAEYFLSFSRTNASANSESEPNDDFMTADATSYGSRVTGSAGPLETDFYSFSGTAGDMVRVQIFDVDNNESSVDDISLDLIGTDGTTSLSYDTGGDFQIYTTILQSTGTFYLQVDAGVATGYTLELTRFQASKQESEPNDTDLTASTLDSSKRASGVIATIGDVDFFEISGSEDRLTRVVVYADNSPTDSDGDEEHSGHGSSLAPLITIQDELGATIATSTSLPTNGIYTESVTDPLPTAQVAFIAPATGTYFVKVENAADVGPSPSQLGGVSTLYYVIEVK
jgi:hypothetical protein